MKVRGWAADEGGCRWYRLQVPLAELARRGHDTGHDHTYTSDWDDAIVIGQRVCNPGPTGLWEKWAAAGRRLIYDLDDDYFHVDPTNRAAWQFYSRQDVQRRIVRNAELASVVTACSPRLVEVMRPYNPRAVVVPNGLPARILEWPAPSVDNGLVTLGWAGTPCTLPDLAEVSGRLRRFLDRHPGVELHTIGMPADLIEAAGLRHERVRVTDHVQGTEAYLRAIDFDVWVAPYRSTPFNRAKAPTKALEAGALGVPVVASDIEPYRRHVRAGETGYLIARDHEWDPALHELVTDPDLRARMGVAGRVQAKEHTIEAIAPQWEEVLQP